MYPQFTPPTESVASDAHGRLIEALTDPDHLFTSEQVAYLMGAAQRWGYEARVDEENDEWRAHRDTPILAAGTWTTWAAQVDARRAADRAATTPRPHDFPGLDNMERAA